MSKSPTPEDQFALSLVHPPIRSALGYNEVQRRMEGRRWVQEHASCPPHSMSDTQRHAYNKLVQFHSTQVSSLVDLLTFAEDTGALGTNLIVWLQGPAGSGKTYLAYEAAAALLEPHSVGHEPAPSADQVTYAHIPIAYMGGRNTHAAGLINGGCTWFGLNPRRGRDDSGIMLAKAMRACETKVVIVDDLHSVSGADRSIAALRGLLNQIPAHVILTSLPPEDLKEASLARDLMSGSSVAGQLRARTRIHRMPLAGHCSYDAYTDSVKAFIGGFKLKNDSPESDHIAEFLYYQSQTQPNLQSLPQAYAVLTGAAGKAVGGEECITLAAVMALVHAK